jgi:aminoglycoside 3-N-acetyltransferase
VSGLAAPPVLGRAAGRDRKQLAADLAALGLPQGRDVLVHCSLRRVGPVAGGPRTLFRAIRVVTGPQATVVVPTQTANNSTTSHAFLEATQGLTEDERERYEEQIAPYDPASSPSFRMGALAEYVRCRPDSVRSDHPQTSFAAVGPMAAEIVANHQLESHLGEESPLAALYQRFACVLLIGVGFEACTALHLAEYRLSAPIATRGYRCFVHEHGRRVRKEFIAPDLSDHDFNHLGEALERERRVSHGTVGQARATLIALPDAVDFAVGWMASHR